MGGRGGAGAGPGGPALFPAGSAPESASADAGEAEIVSSVAPGSGAILSVGALLQAATLVRGLLSAAAGEPDAARRRADGDSRSRDLDGPAAGAAGCGGGGAGRAGRRGRGPARGGRGGWGVASARGGGHGGRKNRASNTSGGAGGE